MSVPSKASTDSGAHFAPVLALIDAEALLPHEQVEPDRLAVLATEIARAQALREPVVVDRRSMVILDGHHRVRVLHSLGCSVIPAYLVDYQDASIQVLSRRSEVAVSKEAVVKRGLSRSPFPPRTTRHMMTPALGSHPVSIDRLKGLL